MYKVQPLYPANMEIKTDEEVVKLAKTGDENAMDYLIKKYEGFIKSKAKSYFLVGGDREDVIQEGRIGLYKAVCDYEPDKLSSFYTFAELCITRQILCAVKTATRQKHIPLNGYVSLNKPIYDEDSDRTMLDVLGTQKTNPEEIFLGHELSDDLREKIQKNLSVFELNVLIRYLEGRSYQNMAKELNHGTKSIDNALQRIKEKVEKIARGTGCKPANDNDQALVSDYVSERLCLLENTKRPDNIHCLDSWHRKPMTYNGLDDMLRNTDVIFVGRERVLEMLKDNFPEIEKAELIRMYRGITERDAIIFYYRDNGAINIRRFPLSKIDEFIANKKKETGYYREDNDKAFVQAKAEAAAIAAYKEKLGMQYTE